ncbi:MFS transporter [Streptomyces sp. NPDC058420]|uniref:MFS transporter n=1 Tax=Streptomyces sp. NPDC058420 TaxID=3346489 RepID=UPI003661912A
MGRHRDPAHHHGDDTDLGRLADLFSKKTLVQVSIAVFVPGAAASGTSQTAGQLIASRALQGVGVGGGQALVQITLAAMIPPRERGRCSGYLSSVTAASTSGGPLLGGIIVDTSWLGWRWCFFIGVPIAAVALFVLQRTLNLPALRRENVKIDYLGATLIASGVGVLLVWVSFVDNSSGWVSWQSAVMVAGGLLLIGAAVWVESRAAEPVVPLGIVRQRTTALDRRVPGRRYGDVRGRGVPQPVLPAQPGHSPTEAGLLTIPMMVGILAASTVAGRLISRTGKTRPFIIAGAVLLTVGFAVLGTTDSRTSLLLLGVAMLCVGMGVGMTLQNLVLVVQNTVPLKDIGAAGSTVSFFRSLGGTIGVSVLGAVLARHVQDQIAHGLASAGLRTTGAATDVSAQPAAVQEIIRVAYGDATAQIFLLSAAAAVLAVIAAILLKPVSLRSSPDPTEKSGGAAVPAEAG